MLTDTLPLLPTPAVGKGSGYGHHLPFCEGFVDEAVVSAMIAFGVYGRITKERERLALSFSEDDYTGWTLPDFH